MIIRPWFKRQVKIKAISRVELTKLCTCFVQRLDELGEFSRPAYCQKAGMHVKMDVVELRHVNL